MGSNSVTSSWAILQRRGWLLSPQLENWQKKIVVGMRARLPLERDGLWLLSSGTSAVGTVKALHLRVSSLELSAQTVNRFLSVTRKDRWLLALPEYHVGGLGVLVRSALSGSSVVRFAEKWNAQKFVDAVARDRVTLVSLVPTQIYDLVQLNLRAPPSLRAVVVGGGALSEDLYMRARALGWPLLPSYGLTECCSQVATARLGTLEREEYPPLTVLPHVQIDIRDRRIHLRSESLCRWVAVGFSSGLVTLEDPLRDGGWMATADRGELSTHSEGGSSLRVLGRADDVVKILGELIPVREVEASLRRSMGLDDLHVAVIRDARQEHSLVAFTAGAMGLPDLEGRLRDFNSGVSGPRRIHHLCWVPEIPRTALGKVKFAELVALLQTSVLV